MKKQGQVRQFALGGRPQAAPMQAIGGVKGANVYKYEVLWGATESVLENDLLSSDQLHIFNSSLPINPDHFPLTVDPTIGSVNVRDNIRMGDASQTPLQFVYEAADCRLFYTLDTAFSPVALWTKVADSVWGKGQCVPGSMNATGSLTLNQTLNGHKNAAPNLRMSIGSFAFMMVTTAMMVL
jgi:hypothetical protein